MLGGKQGNNEIFDLVANALVCAPFPDRATAFVR